MTNETINTLHKIDDDLRNFLDDKFRKDAFQNSRLVIKGSSEEIEIIDKNLKDDLNNLKSEIEKAPNATKAQELYNNFLIETNNHFNQLIKYYAKNDNQKAIDDLGNTIKTVFTLLDAKELNQEGEIKCGLM